MKPHSHCIRYHIVRNLEQPEDIPEVSTTVIPVNNALLPWPVFLAPTRKSVVTRTNTRATEVLRPRGRGWGGSGGGSLVPCGHQPRTAACHRCPGFTSKAFFAKNHTRKLAPHDPSATRSTPEKTTRRTTTGGRACKRHSPAARNR